MQTATIMLAIGGKQSGSTVMKTGVTVAEIAILRHIHGEDAVFDVAPDKEEIRRPHRAERQRLVEKYGRSIEGRFRAPAVDELFPGAAARVFERFDELDIPVDFYKAEARMAPPTVAVVEEPEPAPVAAPVVVEPAPVAAPVEPAPVAPQVEAPAPVEPAPAEADGIEDMNDGPGVLG